MIQLQYGKNNPHLRTKAEEITIIDKEIQLLGAEMLEKMRDRDGVGLAGPQVGVNKRIMTTTQRKTKKGKTKNTGEICMINPLIVLHSEELFSSEEGCLSLPGLQGDVERYRSITVTYTGLDKKEYTTEFSDFNAAIIQHEIDHLDGILFLDKLIPGTLLK